MRNFQLLGPSWWSCYRYYNLKSLHKNLFLKEIKTNNKVITGAVRPKINNPKTEELDSQIEHMETVCYAGKCSLPALD